MKNKILKIITAIAVVVLFISTSTLDSDSILPYVGAWTSLIWILLIVFANLVEDK